MTEAQMIAQLRRMTAEPTTTTYSDEDLLVYIKNYPIPDPLKRGTREHGWVPTYDLHAAAVDIWDEKAAAVAHLHDFNADGGNYQTSQPYQQALQMSRYHAARRRAQNRAVSKELESV